jgi:hypothetical protein
MIVFDIETGPLSEDQLRDICPPFTAPPHPGLFDESAVKLGNIKDPDKRSAKIEEARAAHEAEVAGYEEKVKLAQSLHFDNFRNKAALDPTTGQVLAIGYLSIKPTGGTAMLMDTVADHAGESALISKFWEQYTKCHKAGRKMTGLNILGFDLPFLIRRSWILGVDIPQTVRPGRYFDQIFIDIRDTWLCGQNWGNCESSLGAIAKALGAGEKSGNGADFAELLKIDRESALAYLRNDLELTAACATRMGVV